MTLYLLVRTEDTLATPSSSDADRCVIMTTNEGWCTKVGDAAVRPSLTFERRQGNEGTRQHGNKATRQQGNRACLIIWSPGCLVVWWSGCLVVRLPGGPVAWSPC